MRKFTLLLALAVLCILAQAPAQTPGVKGNGEVFFSETFGWENPLIPKAGQHLKAITSSMLSIMAITGSGGPAMLDSFPSGHRILDCVHPRSQTG